MWFHFQCVDSKQHCESASASALNPEAHRIPVAQQLIRRGPLIIRRHLDTYPEGDFDPSAREAENATEGFSDNAVHTFKIVCCMRPRYIHIGIELLTEASGLLTM